MTQDTRPFWQRPLPPIQYPADPLEDAAPVTDGLPVDTDPLAEPETAMADGAAPADDDSEGIVSSPQAHPVPFDTSHANGDASPPVDTVKAAPRPVLSVVEAQRRLVEVQLRCACATDRQREMRGKLGLALEKFQRATLQTQTPEQLLRQHLESEARLREDRKAGRVAPRPQRRLGSAIDAFAFHTKDSGRGAGGGRAFGRGAYPKAMRGRVIPKD
jgi:hypothetical protein